MVASFKGYIIFNLIYSVYTVVEAVSSNLNLVYVGTNGIAIFVSVR